MTKKISLCMIVGNVEDYIERCLSSFRPLVDEICIVRAIGGLKPDRTLELAMDNFGAQTAEYLNGERHRDWPHVDDFAAARQQSFDMATGDYCLWCDSDDILENPEEAAKVIRELADKGGACGWMMTYRIFGRGINLPRERMMLKRAGKWKGAVHEFFEFHQPSLFGPLKMEERVVITHLPHNTKAGSNDRNLRILQSLDRETMSTGLLYHLHVELLLSGDTEGGVEIAKEVLMRPDLGRPERFEVFLNLAQKTDDPAQKEILLHQAYMADPRRREALGLLTNNALNMGEPSIGLAYARQMAATPPPKERTWNDRASVYSWVGDDLHAQALRANGMAGEAEQLRQAGFSRAGGPRIALIHATRGRPEQASRCRKIWLDLAQCPERVEHIFCIDADDVESRPLMRMHHTVVRGDGGCVAAWNAGALQTSAPIIIQLSDDWTPPPMWDELIASRISDPIQPAVLAISDGNRKDDLLCMAICTRAYLALDYFLFHPWFKGVYSDNYFTQLAYKRKMVIDAKDLVFQHDHPAFNPAVKMDATYAAQNSNARYQEGLCVLEEITAGGEWSCIPGYFNYWQFYEMIARGLKDGDSVAEVGVWLGRSIIFLAQTLQRQGKKVKLYAVDWFKGAPGEIAHVETVQANGGSNRAVFEAHVKRCRVENMIEILEGDSAEMASKVPRGTLSFCWIDAAHDYASVKRDVEAWNLCMKPGGVLAGHDAEHEEVFGAVTAVFPNAKRLGCIWVKA